MLRHVARSFSSQVVRTSALCNTRGFAAAAEAAEQVVKVPIKQWGVEGRYCEALYVAAKKAGTTFAVQKELDEVEKLISENEQLARMVEDPTLNKKIKEETIKEVLTKAGFSDMTVNFYALLAQNSRMSYASKIYDNFTEQTNAEKGALVCKLTTSVDVSQTDFDQALKRCKQEAPEGTTTVSLEANVNEGIEGGWILEIGDKYLDYSGKTRKKNLQAVIMSGA